MSILQTQSNLSNQPRPDLFTVSFVILRVLRGERFCLFGSWPYSNFAVIVIFAFSTFDTGQPFSAASAYF
jgi:hypothetical protein